MTHFHYQIFYELIRKIANSFRKLGLPNFRNHKIVPKFLRFARLSGASVKKKVTVKMIIVCMARVYISHSQIEQNLVLFLGKIQAL
jgi:hypothetical protein